MIPSKTIHLNTSNLEAFKKGPGILCFKMKTQPVKVDSFQEFGPGYLRLWPSGRYAFTPGDGSKMWMTDKTYQEGLILQVREGYLEVFEDEIPEGRPRGPKAPLTDPLNPERVAFYVYASDGDLTDPEGQKVLWMPGVFMPKEAIRLKLEVWSVSCKRRKDVEPGAIVLGAPTFNPEYWFWELKVRVLHPC